MIDIVAQSSEQTPFGGAVVRAGQRKEPGNEVGAFHLLTSAWVLSSILVEDFIHHIHVKRVSQRSGYSGFLQQGKLTVG